MGDLLFRAMTELINAFFGILTFGILSRMLSIPDYAVVNQVISLGNLLAPIILLKLNTAFCIFLPAQRDLSILKSRYLTSLLTAIPTCAVVFLALFFGSGFISRVMFNSSAYAALMGWMAFYYCLLALSTLSQDFYRATKKIKFASCIVILKVVLTTLILFLMAAGAGILALKRVIIAYGAIELFIFLFCFVSILYQYRGIPVKIKLAPLKEYYQYALPLMPYLIMNWINTTIGKFILNHLTDLEISGIYSFNYAMVSRAFFLSSVISYTIFPYISKYWNEGNKQKVVAYLNRAFNIAIFFSFPIILGIIATAPTIVEILSGGNFPVNRLLIAILCISALFEMIFGIYAYLIDLSRKTMWYNMIFLIACFINIGLNFILIPKLGLYGAGITALVTSLFQLILTIIIGGRSASIRLTIHYSYVGRSALIAGIMYGMTMLIYRDNGILNFILSIVIAVTVYFGLSFLVSRWSHTDLI